MNLYDEPTEYTEWYSVCNVINKKGCHEQDNSTNRVAVFLLFGDLFHAKRNAT
jgi:hypothetical protein